MKVGRSERWRFENGACESGGQKSRGVTDGGVKRWRCEKLKI